MEELEYNEEKIPYKIIQSKIKNMYIHIKEGQVVVKAPIRLSEKKIKEFINLKAKWIYEKWQEEKNRNEKEIKIEKEDRERLQKVILESIDKYEKTLQVKPNKVRIREIKYAWGSCSSHKNMTFNLKLATKDEKVIEYVVLHEMCHLIHMNHSKEFWNLVDKNMKEYKKYKKMLKS